MPKCTKCERLSCRRPLTWVVTETGCHEPTSHKTHDGHGYPSFHRNGNYVRMYRLFYEQKFGPVPHGLVVRHTCDNRKCINVEHLLIGTRADNMRDRHTRGPTSKGELNGMAKISEEDAKWVLTSIRSPEHLAKVLKVRLSTIQAIQKGRRWKHIERQMSP